VVEEEGVAWREVEVVVGRGAPTWPPTDVSTGMAAPSVVRDGLFWMYTYPLTEVRRLKSPVPRLETAACTFWMMMLPVGHRYVCVCACVRVCVCACVRVCVCVRARVGLCGVCVGGG
jgi:hypothetical protein